MTWKRVSRGRPCAVCGKPDWCIFAGPDDNPEVAICQRVESNNRRGEGGWLHRLRGGAGGGADRQRGRTFRIELPSLAPGQDFEMMARGYSAQVEEARLQRFAGQLGLQAETLQRFGVGWSPLSSAWAFPMSDGGGRVVGVHLRLPDGRKLSVKGSKVGLFIPSDLGDQVEELVIAEGMSDAATMVEMEFRAVGRQNCESGKRDLVALVRRLKVARVVIVADGDPPGQRGASNLCSVLLPYLRGGVRVVTPPDGMKDVRRWRQEGATRADLLGLIEAAPVRRLQVKFELRKKG